MTSTRSFKQGLTNVLRLWEAGQHDAALTQVEGQLRGPFAIKIDELLQELFPKRSA